MVELLGIDETEYGLSVHLAIRFVNIHLAEVGKVASARQQVFSALICHTHPLGDLRRPDIRSAASLAQQRRHVGLTLRRP